jgi:hypothetical protein
MKSISTLLVAAVFAVWANPLQAQLIFSKKPKVNPSQRVPELILIVKTDKDDRKRASAAEELREYDVKVFAEIVPVLADILQHDKKAQVRAEALTSLARIRPVSSMAGQALEKAAAKDEAWRLRLQAKTALARYYLSGYSSKKSDAKSASNKKPPVQTEEPPTAAPVPIPLPPAPLPAPRVEDSRVPRPLPPGVVTPAPGKKGSKDGPSVFPD